MVSDNREYEIFEIRCRLLEFLYSAFGTKVCNVIERQSGVVLDKLTCS